MDEMEALCARIAILCKGEIVALGSAAELKVRHGSGHALRILLGDPSHAAEGGEAQSLYSWLTGTKSSNPPRMRPTY